MHCIFFNIKVWIDWQWQHNDPEWTFWHCSKDLKEQYGVLDSLDVSVNGLDILLFVNCLDIFTKSISILLQKKISPLSFKHLHHPKSDQLQYSPNNISRSSRGKVMKISKLITKGRTLWSYTKFSQLFLKEMYVDLCGEFVCGSWALKG